MFHFVHLYQIFKYSVRLLVNFTNRFSTFPNPQGQFQPNLIKGIKIIQMKGTPFLKGRLFRNSGNMVASLKTLKNHWTRKAKLVDIEDFQTMTPKDRVGLQQKIKYLHEDIKKKSFKIPFLKNRVIIGIINMQAYWVVQIQITTPRWSCVTITKFSMGIY